MIAGYLFGFNVGVFNSSMNNVSHTLGWGSQKTAMIALCSAIMPAGGFFGGMSASVISNKYGRRKAMIFADIIGFFAAGITILPHTSTFVIGRFMSGIMVGLLSSISSTYMSEISPSEIRGKTGSFFQLLRMIGLTTAYVLGLGLPTDFDEPMNDWWRFMFAYPALLNIVQGMMFLFVFKYESPYWLIKNGESDQTMSVLNSLYLYDVDKVYEQISSVKADPLDSEINGPYFTKIWKMFRTPKVNKMLRLGLILGVFQPLSGYSAIATYSTMLFTNMTGDYKQAKQFTVIFGCVGIFAVFVMMQIIERFGRRSLLITGTVGMFISNLLVGAFLVSGLWTPYPTLAFIYFYMFNFNISIGPVLLPYISEVGIPLVTSLCVGILWLGFLVVGIIVPYAIAGFGPGPLFFIFMGICLMGLIYIILDVVETKGKTKEEIRKIIVKDTRMAESARTPEGKSDPLDNDDQAEEGALKDTKEKHKKHKHRHHHHKSKHLEEDLPQSSDYQIEDPNLAEEENIV
jgi:SP family arabinose:H+ symporter-like MFS transporter